jgi:hypothetical protein
MAPVRMVTGKRSLSRMTIMEKLFEGSYESRQAGRAGSVSQCGRRNILTWTDVASLKSLLQESRKTWMLCKKRYYVGWDVLISIEKWCKFTEIFKKKSLIHMQSGVTIFNVHFTVT